LTQDQSERLKKDPVYKLLQAEVARLEQKVSPDSSLGEAMQEQLKAREGYPGEDRRIKFFQRVVSKMTGGEFPRFVPSDTSDDIGKLGSSLVSLENVLDRKFAEVRALAEVTADINEGLFLDEVLNHIFESFRPLIPYDRIGFALLEEDGNKEIVVRAHWSRSEFEQKIIGKGYSAPLAGSSLETIIETGDPRIINDLQAYLQDHPDSNSTKLIVKEGVRSNLTCPLIAKGEPIGFMFFSSREASTYLDAHVELFQQIAGQLALTVEKGRLYQDLTVRNQFIRKIFGRYLTDEVAESLLNDPDALKLGGDRRKITILMSDLRGFTRMSEHASAEQVVSVLNNFLSVMVEIIMRNNGTIDNIIGDAILVLFGAPVAREDDAERAVACALEMQQGMARVNEINRDMGLPEVAMGIGINTGEVIAGNIGSEMHMKYSVIGSPVNLAARIEGLTTAGQILSSAQTLKEVGDILQYEDHGAFELKGFDQPVPVFDITGIGGAFGIYLGSDDDGLGEL